MLPGALIATMLAVLVGIGVASAAEAPPECAVAGASLQDAKVRYADSCSLPRIDCDPIDGTWYCSSRVIGNAAPGGVTADDVGSSGIGDGTIVVTVPTTAPNPTTTVSPTTQAPTTSPTTVTPTTDTPTTDTPTTDSPTTTTGSDQENSCGIVAVEAESLALTGAWKVVSDSKASAGKYITWEGLSTAQNNQSPADIVSLVIEVDKPGTYHFTWAMRQPAGVDSDKANDSWLNFPDASRFGPVPGGTYSGFIKVFGNSTGDFAYSATADVNHNKSKIAVEFATAGTYTMQIGGRSHGHQIDRIVLYHDSINKSDAVAGAGGDCGDDTPTTTAPPTTAPPTTAPPTTVPPTTAPPTTVDPGTCNANTSGEANLARDLISLHYDHAPDRDDAHATAAGKEVATRLGFTPWVVGGAYGADNKNSYRPQTEPVMDAVWGAANWTNADADWNGAVRVTADRWQQTLQGCGDIWIAEGGQSDFSADVVRELQVRMPGLDTTARIHLVQHSNWNEDKALDADLAYVKNETDYIRIPDGNGGGNGTADFNDEDYNGPFIQTALNGPNGAGWQAAFDYYPPRTARLDFSDTVELMEILDVGTDQVNDIEDFADTFMR